MTGGRTLRARRLARGLSQEGLAREIGVSLGTVANWEAGRAVPHLEAIERADTALEAGGEIVQAFGYIRPGTASELPELVARLADQLAEHAVLIAGLSAEVARLRASRRRGGNGNGSARS